LVNKEEIKKKIKKILAEKDEVIFAYLHGSFNEIYFRDVDVAVYVDESKVGDFLDYELRISTEIENVIRLPVDIKVLLEINEKSTISVYNILIIQKPLEKSTINFLAPILINHDNNKLAQVVLEPRQNPDFGMAESIESFRKEQ